MPINTISHNPNTERKDGCLHVFLFLMVFSLAIVQMFHVSGFWLGCGMFLTISVGGLIGGKLGLKIGGFIGDFTCPSLIFTQVGLLGILRIKLFWLFGPRIIGLIFGAILGIHLLLLLLFGMPVTSLGTGKVKKEGAGKQITLTERKEILKKNLEFIEKMQNADPQTKNNMLLMVAIDSGSIVTVKKLLAEGVDINAPRIPLRENGLPYTENGEELTPLWCAISHGFDRNEIAMLLIQYGAEVNVRNEKFKGPTPLLYVLRNDRLNLVIPLIQAGANLDVVDVDGKTPLHHTVNRNMIQESIAMVEKGAKLDVKDRFGNTPMDYASKSLKQELMRLLSPNKQQ